MYHSIRRGLKRKEPGQDPELGDYQAGVNQFQAAVRKRESMRLKLQMNSAPGILEKELMNKMKVEDSVCQVCCMWCNCSPASVSLTVPPCQGIAKFLAACKNETQSLEAAKNLQLGQLRLDMLKFELNKLRRGRGSPVRKQGNPSYAAVSLSDIRLPLLWRPRDHMQV